MTPQELRKLRKQTGLTQERFAHMIGVTMATVWRWEHDQSPIDGLRAEGIRAKVASHLTEGKRRVKHE